MGTRAITNVTDEAGNIFVSLYRQYDGYPNGGHGEELAEFLEDAIIGNGIRMGENRTNFFNGIGDLACRMVAHFKSGGDLYGGFYIVPPDGSWEDGVDFVYTVRVQDPTRTIDSETEGSVKVKVKSWDTEIFKGTNEEFAVWVRKPEDEEDW